MKKNKKIINGLINVIDRYESDRLEANKQIRLADDREKKQDALLDSYEACIHGLSDDKKELREKYEMLKKKSQKNADVESIIRFLQGYWDVK